MFDPFSYRDAALTLAWDDHMDGLEYMSNAMYGPLNRVLNADFNGIYVFLPVENPWFGLFCIVSSGILAIAYYRSARRSKRRPVNFYISDYWAATLAVLPTFLLLCGLLDNEGNIVDRQRATLFVYFFTAICTGVFIALIFLIPRPNEKLRTQSVHFWAVLGGGWLGLACLFLAAFNFHSLELYFGVFAAMFNFVAFFLTLCYLYPPLLVPTAFVLFVGRKSWDLLF